MALQETWLFSHDLQILGTVDPDFGFTGKSSMDVTTKTAVLGRPWGGVAILYRRNVFSSVQVVECKSARLVAIKVVVNDRSFLVFSVHMPVNSADNLVEFTDCLSEICAIIESTNISAVFMLGDFNASPTELFGREILKFCTDQNWRCADFELLGSMSGTYTFISDVHGTTSWLDHCLVTESAWQSVVSVRVLDQQVVWSDHFPLEVKCNISIIKPHVTVQNNVRNKKIWGERNVEQILHYQKLCNDKLKYVNFPCELSECCDNLCNAREHRLVIDELYKSIVNILCDAAEDSAGIDNVVKFKKRVVVGWNKHVKSAHRTARDKFHVWLWHGKPTRGHIYDDMSESRRAFKSQLKWCQNNAEQIKMDILASHHTKRDFKSFWKATNKLNPKVQAPLNVDGVSDPQQAANLFKSLFQVEPAPIDGVGSVLYPEIQQVPSGLLPHFTARDVALVIKNMTRGKSPGHDGISIEHLQHAGVHLPRVLAMFYTFCVRHSYIPNDCLKTVVVPIIKNKTGDPCDSSNYRPISLATTVAKVLDGLLDRILGEHITLNDAQFGFRPGLSTETAILCLKHTVRYYTDRKTPVYACFLDLSKAFDLVSYDVLWRKMRSETSLPDEIIKLFNYWYNNQMNVVRWAGELSDAYGLRCGVRQGGLSSPRIFNMYVNGLVEELSGAGVGCSIDGTFINNISYADDMVLLGPSVSAIRRLLGICERYAGAHGLRYNVKKSELLVFKSKGFKTSTVPPLLLSGVPLARVARFKYLGHWITEDLADAEDIERERRALAVRSNMLARRFARCTAEVKISLFKAYCQSFYTCSLWVSYSRKTIDALRVQYNNALRRLLGLPWRCSASGMFADARVDGFHAIMRKRAASMLSRVRGSANSILSVVAGRPDCPIICHAVRLHVNHKNN